jgi:hypothetical protein
VSEPAKKYGIAVDLPEEVDPKDSAVVLQYDLRLQKGLECGGAYLKYLLPQVSLNFAVISTSSAYEAELLLVYVVGEVISAFCLCGLWSCSMLFLV